MSARPAKPGVAGGMSRNPVSGLLLIDEEEFRPIVIGNPNQPRRNSRGSTQRDKAGGAFFTVSDTAPQRSHDVRVVADTRSDVFPHPLVKLEAKACHSAYARY